jgi:hypothetical protein
MRSEADRLLEATKGSANLLAFSRLETEGGLSRVVANDRLLIVSG